MLDSQAVLGLGNIGSLASIPESLIGNSRLLQLWAATPASLAVLDVHLHQALVTGEMEIDRSV